jgi:phage terminase small subunit
MTDKFPPPPKGLRIETQGWWREITHTFVLESSHLKLLTLACRAWDRASTAREAIAKHGLSFTDKHGVARPRPEVVIERNSSILFARLVRELRLSDTPEPDEPLRNSIVASRRK